jgi:DEAD/DEAH box helicase domain-containing protein
LRELPEVESVAIRRTVASAGREGSWPGWVDDRLIECWSRRGVTSPYAHQIRALETTAAGGDVLLATATASGKSLCFQTPVVQAVLDDPGARALFLFPTKALARDQVEGLRNLVGAGTPLQDLVGSGVYDGDTPPDQRRAARSNAHVVASNPDMLHRAVLPHHDRWSSFLAGLRYVVIDELHTYRGLFGSHVGNVLRRLLRVCAFHGSRPQVIACSATIANPRDLARGLIGREEFDLIDENTAPAGSRTFLILNPAVVDPATGVRRDYLKVTRRVASILREESVPTLAFCRTRKAVELLTRYLREDECRSGSALGERDEGGHPREARPADPADIARARRRIRGYRGGYLPGHRREIEEALRSGEAKIVASTNALELGMDIGGLDAVVLAGYPGTRAATVQRSGRAGRRGSPALTVLVLSSAPLDQFIAAAPGFLMDEPPEHARVDPDNPEVLVPHLRCAAYELPFNSPETGPCDRFGPVHGDELGSALEYLAGAGSLHSERFSDHGSTEDPASVPCERRRYFTVGDTFPADGVDLRRPLEENFVVVEVSKVGSERGRILAEVDFADASSYVHVGAIYVLEGRCYEVLRLDWDARKAYVQPVRSQYYTEAVHKLKVRMLDPSHSDAPERVAGTGYAHVVKATTGFKKLRFRTHENIGFGPINLPDLELHTVAAFWRFPEAVLRRLSDPRRRATAALGAAHALRHVAAMVLMCDVRDLGHAIADATDDGWAPIIGKAKLDELRIVAGGRPTLYLYDRVPGGAGLSSHAHALGAPFLRRVAEAVAGCSCRAKRGGCPVCMGTEALQVLDAAREKGRGEGVGGEPAIVAPASYAPAGTGEERRNSARASDDVVDVLLSLAAEVA